MFSLAKYSLNLYNICCLGNKELTNEHQLLSTGLKRHFVCVLHFLGQCTWVFCLWVIWGIFHLCNGGQHYSERKPGRTRGYQRPPKGCWNSHIARPERNSAWTGLELTTPGSVRCTSALTNSATSFFREIWMLCPWAFHPWVLCLQELSRVRIVSLSFISCECLVLCFSVFWVSPTDHLSLGYYPLWAFRPQIILLFCLVIVSFSWPVYALWALGSRVFCSFLVFSFRLMTCESPCMFIAVGSFVLVPVPFFLR